MLHSVVAPNLGHPVVHHVGEGATAWGQTITPSIAHLVQIQRQIAIDYSRIAPGIVFEVVSGLVMMPHVVDQSTFRFHADAVTLRHGLSRPDATADAVLRCEVGDECTLRLWGRVTTQEPSLQWEQRFRDGSAKTIPIIFTVMFWEISRSSEARIKELLREAAEKDSRIRELSGKVALSMCSQ